LIRIAGWTAVGAVGVGTGAVGVGTGAVGMVTGAIGVGAGSGACGATGTTPGIISIALILAFSTIFVNSILMAVTLVVTVATVVTIYAFLLPIEAIRSKDGIITFPCTDTLKTR
jgi:hypothetical protein